MNIFKNRYMFVLVLTFISLLDTKGASPPISSIWGQLSEVSTVIRAGFTRGDLGSDVDILTLSPTSNS